jgi:hypothetical protein
MPFNAALTEGQITQVRKQTQAFEHYLLVNPNDIVWQAEVNDTKSGENYADFEWANTQQGDRTHVMVGMVMVITDAADDFSAPVLRGRIRAAPGATSVYVNETGTNIDATMYVTVFDDFDIMERLQRVGPDGTKYKDWDDTWSDLPPIIAGLQSVYADFSEADPVAFSFSPTATAVASGANISTWAWDIDDGSFTGGTSDSDQNIQCTFPGYGTNEHRWVHLTVTDDNGNAATFHFEVYTIAKNSSSAVKLDTGQLQITGTIEEGWNATISAWDGMALSEVYDQTRVAIAGIDNYDGTATPIVSNILMVGRLRSEDDSTDADELATVDNQTTFTIEGFATQLARIPAPALSIEDQDAPDAWGEMTDPDPLRAIVYFLAFHTTFCSLSAISHDTLTDYVLGDFSLGETNALDNVNQQMESCNGVAAFAPSGETTLRRMASYQSDADRVGLTTVFGFTTADITPNRAQLYEYGETVGEIEAGAVVYNTTLNDIQYRYIGRAPASSFGSGHESVQLNGQVLVKNSSDSTARAELIQRTADHLAYVNPKARLTVGLMDGFWFLIPSLHQRYTFTLGATDTARGRVYSTSDYWQLISITYTADNATNERLITATFEEETQGGNAGVAVTLVPDINALDYSLPPISAYDFFPDDPLTNFPVDDPEIDPYLGGGMLSAMMPDSNNQDSPIGCEVLNIPMWYDASRATTRNTTLGEPYVIRVEGEATLNDEWVHTLDFRGSNEGFSILNSHGSFGANGIDGTDDGTPGDAVQIEARRTLGAAFDITSAVIVYSASNLSGVDSSVQVKLGGTSAINVSLPAEGSNKDITAIGLTLNGAQIDILFDTGLTDGQVTVHEITFSGPGANPFSGTGTLSRGDAFYYGYDEGAAELYPGDQGLTLDGDRPDTIGSFSPSHVYEFTATGDGSTFSFSFDLSDYTDVSRNILKITICGDNMGTTV